MKRIENIRTKGLNTNLPRNQAEMASIVSYTYNGLMEEFIRNKQEMIAQALKKIKNRKILTILFLVISIVAVMLIPLPITFAIFITVLIGLILINSAKKEHERICAMVCSSRITRMGRFTWNGRLVPFENGSVLIDESDSIQKKQFSFPVLNSQARDVWNLFEKVKDRITDLPIIQQRLDQEPDPDDEESAIRGQVEKDLTQFFDKGAEYFQDFSTIELNIGIFTGHSPTPSFISSYWDKFQHIPGKKGSLGGTSDFAKLEQLWKSSIELSRELPCENVNKYIDDFEERLGFMSEVRDLTLINHISGQMKLLNDAYKLNNVEIYCPNCYKKSTEESDMYRDEMVSVIDDSAEKRFREVSGRDTLSGSINVKDQILQSSTMTFNIDDGVWECSICGSSVPFGADLVTMHRTKKMIVYPLWDILWRELDVERNRIRREKEAELRDNKKRVNSELMQLQKDFVEERRLIRTKAEELYEKSEKTIIQLSSMVNAFEGMEILEPATARLQRSKIDKYSHSHLRRLDELSTHLEEAEQDIKGNVRSAFTGQETIIDYVDEVRASGRFLTEEKEDRPQITIGSSHGVDLALLGYHEGGPGMEELPEGGGEYE